MTGSNATSRCSRGSWRLRLFSLPGRTQLSLSPLTLLDLQGGPRAFNVAVALVSKGSAHATLGVGVVVHNDERRLRAQRHTSATTCGKSP